MIRKWVIKYIWPYVSIDEQVDDNLLKAHYFKHNFITIDMDNSSAEGIGASQRNLFISVLNVIWLIN